MKLWRKVVVNSGSTIKQAIETIDSGALGVALVVDENFSLIGTITDGDVRRGILKGLSLEESVQEIMNRNPIVSYEHDSREDIINKMKAKRIRHLPIIDHYRTLIHLETLDDIVNPIRQENWVVLMAGGLGSRLRPLTYECPKPLLNVGGKPLLETIIENLMGFGFYKFYLSVNYKAEMVEQHFGDGTAWGAQIKYIHENKRLGTAGALSLLPEAPKEPFIVMNGDLLTKVNFKHLLDFHTEHESLATMCVREFEYQVPYGVVNVNNHQLISIEEKPILKYFVNAGIYVLDPKALEYVPNDVFFDMPSLYQLISERNGPPSVFPIREYWLDIGRLDDFEKANEDYFEVFR